MVSFSNDHKKNFAILFFDVYYKAGFDSTVDPFLWTMGPELFGSAIVFCILFIYPYIRWQNTLLVCLGAFLLLTPWTGYVGDFVIGVTFARARYHGLLARLQLSKQIQLASWVGIVGIAAAHGLLAWKGRATPFEPAMAAMLLMAIFSNRAVFKFFGNRVSRTLGAISFPIYLSQFPVIISLMSFMIVFFARHGPINTFTAAFIICTSFLACVILSVPFFGLEYVVKIAGNRFSQFVVKG